MKIYKVEFNKYNSYTKDYVYNYNDESRSDYIKASEYGCLIKECDLEYYRKYGNGYKKIELIGEMTLKEKTIPNNFIININLSNEKEAKEVFKTMAEKLKTLGAM